MIDRLLTATGAVFVVLALVVIAGPYLVFRWVRAKTRPRDDTTSTRDDLDLPQ